MNTAAPRQQTYYWPDVGEAVAFLEASRPRGTWLFRGQTQRYRFDDGDSLDAFVPPDLVPQLRSGEVDSFLPLGWRQLWRQNTPARTMSDATASFNALIGRIAKLEDEWRDFLLADSFSSFFVSGFFGGVRPTLSIERRTPFLVPLFQHYVFSTVMVDFTEDPRIAAFFAVEHDEPPYPTDHVIYAFDREQTARSFKTWLQRASDAVGMRITSPVLIGFLKLASRYPTGFAARPAAQEGWGLMPAVDPFLFAQAWQDASFERHLFPCTRGELQTLPTRMELFPVDDPFLLVVDRFRKSVRSRWSEWEALFR